MIKSILFSCAPKVRIFSRDPFSGPSRPRCPPILMDSFRAGPKTDEMLFIIWRQMIKSTPLFARRFLRLFAFSAFRFFAFFSRPLFGPPARVPGPRPLISPFATFSAFRLFAFSAFPPEAQKWAGSGSPARGSEHEPFREKRAKRRSKGAKKAF